MDIEAIRERCKLLKIVQNNEELLNEADHKAMGQDLLGCLSYISELESKLRWRKVKEEKPEFRKRVEVKDIHGFVTHATWIKQPEIVVSWKTDKGGYLQELYYPEWREI